MIILTMKVYPENGPEECQSMFKWEFVLKNINKCLGNTLL